MNISGFIEHSKPDISSLEKEAIIEVMGKGIFTTGQYVRKMEKKLLKYLGFESGISTLSGSAAIQLALHVLDIKPGDEVIIPVYICDSVWHAVRAAGGIPVPIDCDNNSCNISIELIMSRISKKTRAILVADTMGYPFDVLELKKHTDIPIIEDACQALGSYIYGKHVGSFAEFCVLSFNSTKMITGGTGGFLAFSNKKNYIKAKSIYNANDGKISKSVKYSFAMTDLQAAIILAQLDRLDYFLKRRLEITSKYDSALQEIGLERYKHGKCDIYNNYRYLFPIHTQNVQTILDRAKSMRIKIKRPIEPLYKFHKELNEKDYANTQKFYDTHLSIPLYPSLTNYEVDFIIKKFNSLLVE